MRGSLFATFLVLILSSRVTRADEDLARRPAESTDVFGTRLLPTGAELSSKPVDVNLGPLGRVVVILFRTKQTSFNYTGWVLLPSSSAGSQTYKKSVLPPLSIADGRFSVEVKSIFAANVDADGAPELCVLAQFHEFGTRDAYVSTDCFRWNRSHFDLLGEAGDKTLGLKTAKAVRAHFAKHPLRTANASLPSGAADPSP